MILGFTGTREGLSDAQKVAFEEYMLGLTVLDEFHHGCCVGADGYAGVWVYETILTRCVGHPSDIKSMTDGEALARCHQIRDPLPPLKRNRNIVDACELLIACPKGPEEQRSGTWATVRYARKVGKRVVIVWPNGEVTQG